MAREWVQAGADALQWAGEAGEAGKAALAVERASLTKLKVFARKRAEASSASHFSIEVCQPLNVSIMPSVFVYTCWSGRAVSRCLQWCTSMNSCKQSPWLPVACGRGIGCRIAR